MDADAHNRQLDRVSKRLFKVLLDQEQRRSGLKIFDETLQLSFALQELLAKFRDHREGGEESQLMQEMMMSFDDSDADQLDIHIRDD